MNRLKELRQKNNLTLKKLSEQLSNRDVKISADALAKYERGDREPKIETWKKLAEFYGVSPEYLMGLNSNNFGSRIKELRIKNGLSQAKLAKKIGVKDNTICQYEKGKRHPNNKIWQKLADYFNVSIPSARGEIDTELIAKIAKLLLNLIDPSMDLLIINGEAVSEEDKTLYEEMLLITLINELGSNTEQIVEELKQKMWNSDFIKVLCENGSEYAIKGGIKLVKLYDKL